MVCSACNTVEEIQEIEKIPHNHVSGGICIYCGGKCSVGLSYNLSYDGSYYTLTGIGSCTDTEIVIPDFYYGKPVKNIGAQAFYDNKTITKVTIPINVQYVSEEAFMSCDNLSIIIMDNGVRAVASESFAYCPKLSDIQLSDKLQTIGEYAFSGTNNLSSVFLPASVTTIGPSAFGSNLKSLLFEDSFCIWKRLYYSSSTYLDLTSILVDNPNKNATEFSSKFYIWQRED